MLFQNALPLTPNAPRTRLMLNFRFDLLKLNPSPRRLSDIYPNTIEFRALYAKGNAAHASLANLRPALWCSSILVYMSFFRKPESK